ncbi:cation diffusion facilitator family transporter [Sulfurimonas sp.]
MGHDHHHNLENVGIKRLSVAIIINVVLTFAQIVGGVLSGSLALIADALHNLSDAASLFIALIARKISVKEHNYSMTFGYKRAEVIAAYTNLITLVIVGIYLIYEAFWRFYQPEPIEGWMVIIVASIALIIDIITALLTHSVSKNSINMQVAFLHNVSDALASLAVIISGILILLYDLYIIDTILTLLLASYVLYQAYTMLPSTVNILMQATPKNINIEDVKREVETLDGVVNMHHIHLWQMDEHKNSFEAHIVIQDIDKMLDIKKEIKELLSQEFHIKHSTLEFELTNCKEEHR